jgi:hypothetical protein
MSNTTLDMPTYIRRLPVCGRLIVLIREFSARVASGEITWR